MRPDTTRCALVREREFEQNHLCIGFPSLPAGDEDRYALAVLSAILGGGMSSRLFQSVREERGCATPSTPSRPPTRMWACSTSTPP